MSAQLAAASAPSNHFNAQLVLADGVTAYVQAPTLPELAKWVARLQAEPANDTTVVVKADKTVKTPPAGNASASTSTPASAQVAGNGSAAAGEAGNAAGSATGTSPSAPTASSDKPAESAAVSFDELKKAFLALSTKPEGRAKCEAVLKPFAVAKLSEAKPEQYAAVLAAIVKASAS
jgi:hypothetical protein